MVENLFLIPCSIKYIQQFHVALLKHMSSLSSRALQPVVKEVRGDNRHNVHDHYHERLATYRAAIRTYLRRTSAETNYTRKKEYE